MGYARPNDAGQPPLRLIPKMPTSRATRVTGKICPVSASATASAGLLRTDALPDVVIQMVDGGH
jgi:hypothetical protein